jgi:peroxiredoxin
MVDHSKFAKLGIQLLGISANNPFSQKMFATSIGISYPLLSDHPDLGVTHRYEMLKHIGKAKQPVARGAYFLIDKQGMIRGKWINPPGEVFPNDTLLKAAYERLQ